MLVHCSGFKWGAPKTTKGNRIYLVPLVAINTIVFYR